MSDAQLADEEVLTVENLLRLYPAFGLPHFQRGAVWNDGTRGRLLESLFHGTPCGSIILWKPSGEAAGVKAPGLPLPGNRAADVRWLVIDGQQRLRALHSTLSGEAVSDQPPHEEDDDGGGEDNEDPEQGGPEARSSGLPRLWCLNLQALPELAPFLEGNLADQPLFVRVIDPHPSGREGRRDRRNPRFRFNLWPLALLRSRNLDRLSEYELKFAKGSGRDEIQASLGSVVGRCLEMDRRRFFVVRRSEDTATGRFGLDEMVRIYNRINSAGIRVEAEERAFATLVRIEPDTGVWLAGLFDAIHGQLVVPGAGTDLRDVALRRSQERSFGFRFFMRAFVHCASRHTGRALGSNSLSFELLGASGILRDLAVTDHAGRSVAGRLQARTRGVILELARVLRESLQCDGFQFLPETGSLVVPLELLFAYGSAPELAVLLPWLVLALMVAELDSRELLRLAHSMRKAPNLGACVDILLCHKGLRRGAKDIARRLEKSNVVQDRFVLLLYWLVRKRRARDLSYANATAGSASGSRVNLHVLRGEEPLVSMNMHGCAGVPEKQHIVPFSVLGALIPGSRRAGPSLANNVGNLTYISPALNHFDGGIGAQPMRWDAEPDINLESHFLRDPQEGAIALRSLFESAVDVDLLPSLRRQAFLDFVEARRGLIARGLHGWCEDLRSHVESLLDSPREPVAPIASVTPVAKAASRPLQTTTTIAGTMLPQYQPAAEALIAALVGAGFEANGQRATVDFGSRSGREFHPLISLTWSGVWMSLRKKDADRLGREAVLELRREAGRFAEFFPGETQQHADMTGGRAVKPTLLEGRLAEFVGFLVKWRGRLAEALAERRS